MAVGDRRDMALPTALVRIFPWNVLKSPAAPFWAKTDATCWLTTQAHRGSPGSPACRTGCARLEMALSSQPHGSMIFSTGLWNDDPSILTTADIEDRRHLSDSPATGLAARGPHAQRSLRAMLRVRWSCRCGPSTASCSCSGPSHGPPRGTRSRKHPAASLLADAVAVVQQELLAAAQQAAAQPAAAATEVQQLRRSYGSRMLSRLCCVCRSRTGRAK